MVGPSRPLGCPPHVFSDEALRDLLESVFLLSLLKPPLASPVLDCSSFFVARIYPTNNQLSPRAGFLSRSFQRQIRVIAKGALCRVFRWRKPADHDERFMAAVGHGEGEAPGNGVRRDVAVARRSRLPSSDEGVGEHALRLLAHVGGVSRGNIRATGMSRCNVAPCDTTLRHAHREAREIPDSCDRMHLYVTPQDRR